MATPSYRYVLCDLLTDQLLAVLPLTGVSFSRAISRTGSLSATLKAPAVGTSVNGVVTTPEKNRQLINAAKLLHRYAGRSALWVYRDNAVWWGGIPWTVIPRQDQRGSVEVSVTGATFDSYAHRRTLHKNIDYVQWDQNQLVASLWQTLQGFDTGGDQRGNIGVECGFFQDSIPKSTILRDRTYRMADQPRFGKLIEDLGDVIDGPEHTIDTWVDDAGNRHKTLRVQTRIGVIDPRAVFQRVANGGGRVLEWSHTADAVDGGTTFWARGDAPEGNADTEVEPILSTRYYAHDLLDDGWPLLDVSADYQGVKEVGTLNQYAQALRSTQSGAMPSSDYVVAVGNTGWSPNRLGDNVRLKLTDAWHDNTDLTVRPVAVTVTASEKGVDEKVALTFDAEA
ncbi:hypothetical protein SAMN05428985_11027 [Nocardioides sp. YR527]|uniref:hypothetical protein n=1 Tax=Nocardioides sp. YR527 TaxID=1881028 RepID=UPI000880EAE6|nr:hypothetical protein [Nocardioides sp. YR527]SDL14252.1 hypothetical protein SAMN05428985_11027 [Nocardioides sp. YR527]